MHRKKEEDRADLAQALNSAIVAMDLASVQKLLNDRGVDPNFQDEKGNTALHRLFACIYPKKEECPDFVNILELLLAKGADPNVSNNEEISHTRERSEYGIIEGYERGIYQSDGYTPFELIVIFSAFKFENKQEVNLPYISRAVNKLIDNGADPYIHIAKTQDHVRPYFHLMHQEWLVARFFDQYEDKNKQLKQHMLSLLEGYRSHDN